MQHCQTPLASTKHSRACKYGLQMEYENSACANAVAPLCFFFGFCFRRQLDQQSISKHVVRMHSSWTTVHWLCDVACYMARAYRPTLKTGAKCLCFFIEKKSNIEVMCACNLSLQSGNWSFADALLLSTTQLHYVGAVQHSCISVQVHQSSSMAYS